MRKAYNEIMENVQVDDEMRRRVLRHISQEMDAGAAKMVIRRQWRRYASLAACLAVLLVGSILLLRRQSIGPENEPPVAVQPGMEEAGSAQALAEKAGFDICDIGPLPFDAASVSYTWCWGELAQIRYEGENASVRYRKSRGAEDISGDYNLYSQQQDLDIDGITVTLKGDDGLICLATWQTGGFSYSLSAAPGLAEQDFRALLESALYGA